MVCLTVQDPSGQPYDVDAVIDIGVDGWPMLRPAMIARLGLVWQKLERVILANETEGDIDVY